MFALEGAAVEIHQWARLIAMALVLTAATWYLGWRASAAADRTAAAVVVVPTAIGAACLTFYTLLTVNPLHLLPEIWFDVRAAMFVIAMSMWLFAVLTLVLVGIVDGVSVPVTPVEPLLERLRVPVRKTPAGGLIERIGTTFDNVARFVGYVLAQAGVQATNLAWFTLVVCVRRIRVTLQHTWQLARTAGRGAALAARMTTRVVVIPALGLISAGWLAVVFANNVTDYLVVGAAQALAGLTVAALLTIVALFGTWALLSYRSLQRRGRSAAIRSGAHTVRVTTPYWLLTQAGGGWLVGIPAALGYGEVRVGWITYTSTAIIAVTFVLYLIRRKGTAAERGTTPAESVRVSPSPG